MSPCICVKYLYMTGTESDYNIKGLICEVEQPLTLLSLSFFLFLPPAPLYPPPPLN